MNAIFTPDIIPAILRTTTPILLAALGGLICQKAGIFNIGLEGFMLAGSFVTIAVAHLTGNIWAGVLAAGLFSCILSLIMALVIFRFKANPIIAGLGINGLALGLTTFLMEGILGSTGAFMSDQIKPLGRILLPFVEPTSDVAKLLSYTPLIYIAFFLVVAVYFFIFHKINFHTMNYVGC